MRTITFLLAVMAFLMSGCATTRYGNYVQGDEEQQAILAHDAATQLVALFPPAKTRIALQQPTLDAFGAALVKNLRKQGYAVVEFNPKAKGDDADMPLQYVFDNPGSGDLYRITLLVGDQSITRPYVAEHGTYEPAGYWARKE